MAQHELEVPIIYFVPNVKTVIIPIFQSFVARSILGTDAFRAITSDPKIRIVLLVPDFKTEYYRETFGSLGSIIFEPVSPDLYSRTLSTRMQRLAVWMLPTYFVRYNIEYLRERHQFSAYAVAWFVNRVVAHLPGARTIFRWADRHTSDTSGYDHYFERYRPDLAFSPDVFSHADAHFLLSAQKHGVRMLGMVRSWDCTTNKNLLRVITDRMLANNDQVAEELVRLHGVAVDTITPVGFTQYDAYIHATAIPREQFCEELGIDPSKRIILFAPGGRKITPFDWQYADTMRTAIRDGRLPSDLIILVRNHPQGPADMTKIQSDPLFVHENPGVVLQGNYRGAEMDAKAVQHAIDSIVHCALTVSVNTSFGLDVVLFDKPHIMLGFDGYEHPSWLHSVKRYHQEDNMKDFIETGAVQVATSPDDLIVKINAYLADPTLDADGRACAREHVLWRLDGNAGQRVAHAILRMLSV